MTAKPVVCRVTGIPGGTDATVREQELRELLWHLLSENQRQNQSAVQVSIVPCCYGAGMMTALVDFKDGLPIFLDTLQKDLLGVWQAEMGDEDLEFDQHFHGFTQLYTPTDGITMDIVGITGLDGHAYGGWKGGNLGRMWLRHFLRKDLSEC